MSRTGKSDRVYIPVESVDYPSNAAPRCLEDAGRGHMMNSCHPPSCCCHCNYSRKWGVFQWLPLFNTVFLVLLVACAVVYHMIGGVTASGSRSTTSNADGENMSARLKGGHGLHVGETVNIYQNSVTVAADNTSEQG